MRLLLLTTTTGYQTRAFVEAAQELGLEIVLGSDRCHRLEDPWQDGAIPLRFEDPEASAASLIEYAKRHRVHGVIAPGDRPSAPAARVARALGLPYHPVEAADVCRNKYLSRERLRDAGLNVPAFTRYDLSSDPTELARAGEPSVGFPCVVKPLALSASRGVIRANSPEEFVAAFERVRDLLQSPDVRVLREDTSGFIQVESYIEGAEVAVEGLVERGRLRVLAVFDKPDPLTGPYFEETIYVTPSRLSAEIIRAIEQTLERAVAALGLTHGPLHAEFRVNARGVFVLEVAARPIGGICSRALRFIGPGGKTASLEQLLIRLALGQEVSGYAREGCASGVMMIPTPEAGIYQSTGAIEEARAVESVEDIVITAKPDQKLLPLPEGASYLGFIFARAPGAGEVENALRSAHARLRFTVAPALPVV